jgi:hypothetical protein
MKNHLVHLFGTLLMFLLASYDLKHVSKCNLLNKFYNHVKKHLYMITNIICYAFFMCLDNNNALKCG